MKHARTRRLPLLLLAAAAGLTLAAASTEWPHLSYDPTAVVGPDECAECHEAEVQAWRTTHHYRSFNELTRQTETLDMAAKLNIERVRQATECVSCHYTQHAAPGPDVHPESIAGISCEMCHGPARQWLEPHADYGAAGSKESETEAHRAERIRASVALGFNHPDNIYDVARNCYGCHLGPDERIVNLGGHSPGSRFELVAWSQGEVRHNLADDPTHNAIAPLDTQRRMFVVGQCLELAGALRGVTGASERGRYIAAHVARIKQARETLRSIADTTGLAQVEQVLRILDETRVSLDNKPAIAAAADTIEDLARQISEQVDPAALAGLDDLLPKPEDFHGEAMQP
ncbi:MAG: hypothetical protein KDA21_07500 [Phycisphaerales bacterium]|nr:hypothetical protein [Phycisphaerales bacterium]